MMKEKELRLFHDHHIHRSVNMSTTPNLMYSLNTIPQCTPQQTMFEDINKLTLKFIWTGKGLSETTQS